ncbi:glycosyltransferase family 2 protein [Candidatus Saccharibacteria bacterium]|nr:glycosyltransferase family 2 protein [Candidatus Saccharibacteria bacterium]MBH1972999.1 glycosyltransferase family 2 protein [Candidatus Saccharibacteria bacterium]MBH1991202.1 glycosyltransferase family 2 protein [Candidatus Saccharibacteria bacterium]
MIDKLVSIVVPVYNVEEYIVECLDSILSQTYGNLEVLIIDDGTPDGAGEIADRYAEIDSRVKVIHKKNEGQPKTKNRGIKEATGDFIAFVDSDDYLREDFVENLLNTIVEFNTQIVTTTKTYPIDEDRTDRTVVYSQKQAFEKMFYGTLEKSENGVQLYSRSLLVEHGILANSDRKIGEDFDFLAQALMHCDKIAVDNRKMYYYRPNPKSLMRQSVNKEIMKSINTYATIGKTVMKKYPDIQGAVDAKTFNDSVALAIRVYDERQKWRGEVSEIFANIHNLKWQILFDNKARRKVRLAALIYCVFGNILGTEVIRRIKK